MSKTTKETLTEARDLITDPAKWTQHSYAKDVDGRPTYSNSEAAVCWCSLGALQKVIYGEDRPGERSTPPLHLYSHLKESMDCEHIGAFNDKSSHEEVLAAFDRAIEGCEG